MFLNIYYCVLQFFLKFICGNHLRTEEKRHSSRELFHLPLWDTWDTVCECINGLEVFVPCGWFSLGCNPCDSGFIKKVLSPCSAQYWRNFLADSRGWVLYRCSCFASGSSLHEYCSIWSSVFCRVLLLTFHSRKVLDPACSPFCSMRLWKLKPKFIRFGKCFRHKKCVSTVLIILNFCLSLDFVQLFLHHQHFLFISVRLLDFWLEMKVYNDLLCRFLQKYCHSVKS